ncbi:OmpA family protein [Thalassomonas viridans]|uniref:OmpA family protein n=1 Tax=Thalassomonas viridans TaxID=137584 RepID=A0AAE9Z9V4_9GAMM|nr:OmpA family protein [Thalassomonas viridans]WDE08690.1 OmpA family protein [Thalassomonas viridans]
MRRINNILDSHNSGGWKIAFADFAMAMMAVFMILWMTAIIDEEKRALVAQYFSNTENVETVKMPLDTTDEIKKQTQEPEQEPISTPPKQLPPPVEPAPVELDKPTPIDVLIEKIKQSPALQKYSKEVVLSTHALGLKIQIMDSVNQAMFTLGDSQLTSASSQILTELAPLLNETEQHISISGHTDSLAYPKGYAKDNWTLSVNRADSARQSLLKAGLKPERIAEIVGMGDSLPYDAAHPDAPINRRIAIIVLNKEVYQAMVKARSRL